MARILIGWELGSNRGHVVRIAPLAARLRAEGHEVALALKHVDALGPERPPMTVFQAPIWPAQFTPQPPGPPVSTLIDILCRLGLARIGALGALIAAWDGILAAWQPDMVVAEFAPALQCAARGRTLLVTTGTGFVQPPADGTEMPRLAGNPAFDERDVVDTVDAELRSVGRAPLAHLPALFVADHQLIETFAEIDPYRETRRGELSPPKLDGALEPGGGEEIFVYGFAQSPAANSFWQALAASRWPVRACVPDATPAQLQELGGAGLIAQSQPFSWTQIAKRSRLVVSHGGHGMVCSALIAGLPHLVTWHDLEKRKNAEALSEIGAGRGLSRQRTTAADLTAAIVAAYQDNDMMARTLEEAPSFATRRGSPIADRLSALAQGV